MMQKNHLPYWTVIILVFVIASKVQCLQCYACEGSGIDCNKTQTIKKCPIDDSYPSFISCYLQIDQTKIYVSRDEYLIETRYIKDCGITGTPFCENTEESKAGHLSCKTHWCDDDLCNISEQRIKTINLRKERSSSSASNLHANLLTQTLLIIKLMLPSLIAYVVANG